MSSAIKVLSIFGTRPEAIKLAPVIRKLQEHPGFQSRVCVTAQHREMLDQVLRLFHLEPDYDLDLMQKDQGLAEFTSRALEKLDGVLAQEAPQVVLVQGDTTTVLAASLAAYYRRIRIGHVEAGLRTDDKYNPFPEEMDRRLSDVMADLCFASTDQARQNLLHDGIPDERVFVTGNTVIDALHWMRQEQESPALRRKLEETFARRYGLDGRQRVLLVTGHRRESFGPELESICRGLRKLAEDNPDVSIFYPVHLNPHVKETVHRVLGDVERVHLAEPLDYASFVWLLGKCYLVLTDSGGVQEEAPGLGKPVLVLRKKTERPEGVAAGVAKLVGTDSEAIYRETSRLLHDPQEYAKMSRSVNPYGDGHAAERIVSTLEGRPQCFWSPKK